MLEPSGDILIAIIGLATAIRTRTTERIRGTRVEGRSEPERIGFPCAHVCESCRYMGSPGKPCPACGEDCWLDTELVVMTQILRESEAFDQDAAPRWAHIVSWVVMLAFAGGGVAILASGGFFDDTLRAAGEGHFYSGRLETFVVLIALTVMFLWLSHATRPTLAWALFRLSGGRGRVDRWHIPLGTALDEKARGIPEPLEPLVSPLSATPCIGWLLTAELKPSDGGRRRRVLVEHRSAALEFNGKHFGADQFAVDGRPRRHRALTIDQESRVLRERGLLLEDGNYRLREAIIPLGANVTSKNFPGPKGGFTGLKPGRGGKKGPGGPYRG